jgi:uncharacterized protein (TIGR01244 family)
MKKSSIAALTAACILLPLAPQMLTDTTYFTSFAANFIFAHNLHSVVPGRFYRSAQMSREALEKTIRTYGIKTVIDLRLDQDEPDAAGQTEAQAAESAGAEYRHVPLSSSRADQKGKLLQLLDIYRDAPQPMLVHCSSGTHRSGIASALWLLDREGEDYEQAAEQFSARYGFFTIERKFKAFVQGKPTLDAVLRQYQEAQKQQPDLSIREWLEKTLAEHPESDHS